MIVQNIKNLLTKRYNYLNKQQSFLNNKNKNKHKTINHYQFITLKNIKYKKITQKFNYGQGGFCQLDLLNRNYKILLQTIWQDYCQIQIDGLSKKDQQLFIAIQSQGKGLLSDYKLKDDNFSGQQFVVRLKVPQDYTFKGKINGSLKQIKTPLSNRLRSESFQVQLLGKNRNLKLLQLQTPKIKIKVDQSSSIINIGKLTIQSGQLQCFNFISDKVMISGTLKALIKNHSFIKSLIMYGNAKSQINCGKVFQADSISGMVFLQTQIIDVKRFYKSLSTKQKTFSFVKAEQIRSCLIQSGDFDVQYIKNSHYKPATGKLFKGKVQQIQKQNSNKVIFKTRQQQST